MAVRKWSVSVDEALAELVERHVGDRGLSSFVAQAVKNELERVALGRFLDDLDNIYGPVPETMVERFDTQWPS